MYGRSVARCPVACSLRSAKTPLTRYATLTDRPGPVYPARSESRCRPRCLPLLGALRLHRQPAGGAGAGQIQGLLGASEAQALKAHRPGPLRVPGRQYFADALPHRTQGCVMTSSQPWKSSVPSSRAHLPSGCADTCCR
eukprot:scaffold7_cov378-Prasinococcus_capsulatus_cf.AAC.19